MLKYTLTALQNSINNYIELQLFPVSSFCCFMIKSTFLIWSCSWLKKDWLIINVALLYIWDIQRHIFISIWLFWSWVAHLIKCIYKNMTKKYLNAKTQCNILTVHNVYCCKTFDFRSKCVRTCKYLKKRSGTNGSSVVCHNWVFKIVQYR